MTRNILITGASRGIGKAIALEFAKKGDRLFLVSGKNTALLEETKKACELLGAETEILTCDLSSKTGVETCINTYKAVHKTLDVLVNNAGISHVTLFQNTNDSEMETLLDTDLKSVLRLTREAVKLMIPMESGHIISISSVYGIYGASCEVEYSACKGAINAMTKALAKELAPSGISVNAVAPGYIDTEMNAHLEPSEREALIEEIPAGRIGTPEDVAKVVSLLSEAPSYMTGQILEVSGGWF